MSEGERCEYEAQGFEPYSEVTQEGIDQLKELADLLCYLEPGAYRKHYPHYETFEDFLAHELDFDREDFETLRQIFGEKGE